MHRKKRGNTNSRLNTMSGYSRERTRSRPRERNLNDKDFEFNLGWFHDPIFKGRQVIDSRPSDFQTHYVF